MKRCGRCGEDKPLDALHLWSRRDGTQPRCKACRKAYDAAYHQRVRERRKVQRAKRRAEFQRWYRELKESLPCADCGRRFHHAAMTFDHLPGFDKRGDVADLTRCQPSADPRRDRKVRRRVRQLPCCPDV